MSSYLSAEQRSMCWHYGREARALYGSQPWHDTREQLAALWAAYDHQIPWALAEQFVEMGWEDGAEGHAQSPAEAEPFSDLRWLDEPRGDTA
jgi:hypothetical protein